MTWKNGFVPGNLSVFRTSVRWLNGNLECERFSRTRLLTRPSQTENDMSGSTYALKSIVYTKYPICDKNDFFTLFATGLPRRKSLRPE